MDNYSLDYTEIAQVMRDAKPGGQANYDGRRGDQWLQCCIALVEARPEASKDEKAAFLKACDVDKYLITLYKDGLIDGQ